MSSHKTVEDKDRLEKLEGLFFQALDQPEDQRASFLHRACGADRQLRVSLEDMLRADQEQVGLIDTAPWLAQQVGRRWTSGDDNDPQAETGSWIGRYEAWHTSEPDLGNDEKAAEWRARRTEKTTGEPES